MNVRSLAVAFAAAVSVLPVRALADCPDRYTKVTYYKPATLPAADSRCDYNAKGKCTGIEEVGYLYKPPAPKPGQVGQVAGFPLLVFNHGSESNPGPKCAEGKYFSDLGFVVFVPIRRGHVGSTGMTFSEYTNWLPGVPSSHECSTKGQGGPCKMEYLHRQETDVQNAIEYVEGLTVGIGGAKLVDSKRVAIMGHSFGGIVTTFANAKDMGQKAAISIAGASQSWEGNAEAVKEMKQAVQSAVAPIYFLEPMNDHSIKPTFMLAKTAGENCRLFQAALFPASDVAKADGTKGQDGKITADDYKGDWDGDGKTVDPRDSAHGNFTGSRIDEWSPTVLEFIDRYFKNPAKNDKHCIGTSVGDD